MQYWLTAAIAVLGALAAYLAGRLVLLRRDVRAIADDFTEKVNGSTNTLIGTGSWDKAVRYLTRELNSALAVYREKRHLYDASDRRMREDIANLAHDLRTPLTAIVGYLDLLETYPERAVAYTQIMRGRTDLMTQVIAELFEYSLSKSGRPLGAEPTDLRILTENSAVALWTLFTEKGVEPVLRQPDQPVLCMVDRSAAERLITNLLTNAVRHGEGNVEVIVAEDGTLSVANRAPGITALDVEKLFDRYFSVQTADHSSGLGLGIAKSLAEEMGGSMTASLMDDVLRVTVQFPADIPTEQQSGQQHMF